MNCLFSFLLFATIIVTLQSCPNNCESCNYSNNLCLQCIQNHQLDKLKSQCISQIDRLKIQEEKQPQITLQMVRNKNNKIPSRFGLSKNQEISIDTKVVVNEHRILTEIQNCLSYTYNPKVSSSVCEACKEGYILIEGHCQQIPKNCLSLDISLNICVKCKGDLLLENNKCINIHCSLYEYGTEICLECYQNYVLDNENNCVKNILINCYEVINNKCTICNQGYYLSTTKSCETLPFGCHTFDSSLGKCVFCEENYSISSLGTCLTHDLDPNCRKSQNGKCKQCSERYYMSQLYQCIPVSPLCKTYSHMGKCTDCYPGYTLIIQLGACFISSIFNCRKQISNGKCVQCYQGSFVNSIGSCQIVNPLCKTYNETTGNCQSCYQGYALSQGQCITFFNDPNCKIMNSSTQKCTQCASRYFHNGQKCDLVNPLCRNFEALTGKCITCYQGYTQSKGQCKIQLKRSIQNCKVQQNSICMACADFYYFDGSGKCVERNPLCKTFNSSNGNCKSCYPGYLINESDCVIAQSRQIDSCQKLLNSTHCGICNDGFSLKNGMCEKTLAQPSNCRVTDSSTGHCSSCYNGYILLNNKCLVLSDVVSGIQNLTNNSVIAQTTNHQNQSETINSNQIPAQSANHSLIINCVEYGIDGTCKNCSDGYLLNSINQCIYFDPDCLQMSLTNGYCLSCQPGKILSEKRCQQPYTKYFESQANYTNQASWPSTCKNGSKQSPINIQTSQTQFCSKSQKFDFKITSFYTSQDTPQLQVDLKTILLKSSTLNFIKNNQNISFMSKYIMWHHPSEHTVNNIRFDLELQIFHYQPENPKKLFVVSILFKSDPNIQSDAFDVDSGQYLPEKVNFNQNNRMVFHYEGSLPFPPCQQSVDWFVFVNPNLIKPQNFNKIKMSLNKNLPNARNTQFSNDRKVSIIGGACNQFYTNTA